MVGTLPFRNSQRQVGDQLSSTQIFRDLTHTKVKEPEVQGTGTSPSQPTLPTISKFYYVDTVRNELRFEKLHNRRALR